MVETTKKMCAPTRPFKDADEFAPYVAEWLSPVDDQVNTRIRVIGFNDLGVCLAISLTSVVDWCDWEYLHRKYCFSRSGDRVGVKLPHQQEGKLSEADNGAN